MSKQAELLQQELAQANQKLLDLQASFSGDYESCGQPRLTDKLVSQVSYQNQKLFVKNLEHKFASTQKTPPLPASPIMHHAHTLNTARASNKSTDNHENHKNQSKRNLYRMKDDDISLRIIKCLTNYTQNRNTLIKICKMVDPTEKYVQKPKI